MRRAKENEIIVLLEQGYKEWTKGRTFQEYCNDNRKEEEYGTRYVLEKEGTIVSSLILLDLKKVRGKIALGIGSVLTDRNHTGKGYATELLTKCMQECHREEQLLFLFSEIEPAFYQRLGFRLLPETLQRSEEEKCMVYCEEKLWNQLITWTPEDFPEHF